MANLKAIDLLKIFEKFPLFTENDAAKIIRKKPEYVKTLLYRLKKRKLIYKIERGKYTVYNNPLVFASYISVPSYISLWTGLRYYNLTEQLPRDIFIMVPKTKKSFKFRNTRIEFVKTKHFFGFKKDRYNNFDIIIADKEKTIIDCLLSKKVPIDEAVKAIKNADIKKIIDYTRKIKNRTLAKRLGFILEENDFRCEAMLNLIDNNYVLLDTMLKKMGKKNKKWKIIDNR